MERLKTWIKNRVMIVVVAGVMLSTGAAGGSLLASTTRSDALLHQSLIDGGALSGAVPGQFYAITADGRIREPLCSFERDEFGPDAERFERIELSNLLGNAGPAIIRIWNALVPGLDLESGEGASRAGFELVAVEKAYVPSDRLLDHNRRIFSEDRKPDVIRKETTVTADLQRAVNRANCTKVVGTYLSTTDLRVCQLNRVVTERDRLFGVDFMTRCLTPMGGEPVLLPDLDGISILSQAKRTLGLIEVKLGPAPPTG